MLQLTTMPLEIIKPEPNQPPRAIDHERDRQLTESIRQHGILQPPGVRHHGQTLSCVWGHRRVRCGIAAGLKETTVVLLDKPMTETDYCVLTLTENIQRQQLTDVELYHACEGLLKLNPGWLKKDLAARLSLDPSGATGIMSVDDLIPAAREAFLGGAFGLSIAYEISKHSEVEQHQLLAARVGGASRSEIVRQGRNARDRTGTSIKVNRVRVPLATGATVTVTGKSISLESAIQATSDAL